MSRIAPTPPPLPTASGTQTAAAAGGAPVAPSAALPPVTAALLNLPNTLRQRGAALFFVGTVVAQDGQGVLVVRLPEGTVVLEGVVGAKIGDTVRLELPENLDQPRVPVRVTVLPPDTPAVTVDRAPGATVRRTPAARVPLTEGAAVRLSVVQLGGDTRPPALIGAAIGTVIAARVAAIAPPAAAAHLAHTLEAVVVGHTTRGAAILDLKGIVVTLPEEIEVPPGTVLRLALQPRLPLPQAPAPPLPADPFALARGWDTLQQMVKAIGEVDPAAGQNLAARVIARPGGDFLGTLLFVMAAIATGRIPEFLGEPALRAAARTNRPSLLARFGDEFGMLHRLATESAGADWRAFFVPWIAGDSAGPVRLFLRRRRGGHAEDKDQAMRFVVEAELPRLGPVQIDALYRAPRFDLILRTRDPLPEAARNELGELSARAAAAGGLQTRLQFQTTDRFPVDPLEEIGPHARPVVI